MTRYRALSALFDREHLPLNSLPLAMAYVPYQPWETPSLEAALKSGTVFPSLIRPFEAC